MAFTEKWVKKNVPAPEWIRNILEKTGAPITPQEIGINAAELEIALQNAKEVRKRYTVFRLAEDLDWEPPTYEPTYEDTYEPVWTNSLP